MNRLLLLALAYLTACLEPAVLREELPDAGAPPVIDAEIIDMEPMLPEGLTRLASGNFVGFASRVVGDHIYAVDYGSSAIVAQPTRIVTIATDTGTVETFQDLTADMTNPTNLQASDQAVFWLARTSAGTALFRRSLISTPSAEVQLALGPALPTFPAGYTLEAYCIYPSRGVIYVMLVNGASYQLGTVPFDRGSAPPAYTMIASGAAPASAPVSFADMTSSLAVLGTQVYAGGFSSGYGFVLRFDTNAKSVAILETRANTRMRSFVATGVRVYWLSDENGSVLLNITNPITQTGSGTGPVATVPSGTYGLALHQSTFYVTSLPGDATSLGIVTPASSPTTPPTGTTTDVLSIPTCVGMSSQDCTPRIPMLATDDSSIYFSATTGVYKYTRP